jgi:acetyl esterase/lipase
MNIQHLPDGSGRGPREVLTRPARRPDLVLRYGGDADQVADVHLPPSALAGPGGISGQAPLTIFLHGGFWSAEYGREHTAPLAEALAATGIVVCAPEYRRTGQEGGGWPGTFDDVAMAVGRLPGLVAEVTGGLADTERVVIAGHSAGGHLALWAAGRRWLPADSPWAVERHGAALPVRGVVALAAVSDLTACYRWGLGGQAAGALMGGGPELRYDRYLEADPIRLVPAGVPVRLLHGMADDRVPWQMSMGYARATAATGVGAAAATCVLLPGTGHFELIDPLSGAWGEVVDAFWRMSGLSRVAGRLGRLVGVVRLEGVAGRAQES